MQADVKMWVQSLGWEDALQYSCLENPMDRGAWGTIVCEVKKSGTQLNDGAQGMEKDEMQFPKPRNKRTVLHAG